MSTNVPDGADGGDLSAKQIQLAWLLASGRSRRDAAKEIGIDPRTVSRWLHVPAFRAALDDRLDELDEESRDMARSLRAAGTRVTSLALRRMESALEGDDTAATYQAAVDALRASGVVRAAGLMERVAAEHSGDIGLHVDYTAMSDDELRERTERLMERYATCSG